MRHRDECGTRWSNRNEYEISRSERPPRYRPVGRGRRNCSAEATTKSGIIDLFRAPCPMQDLPGIKVRSHSFDKVEPALVKRSIATKASTWIDWLLNMWSHLSLLILKQLSPLIWMRPLLSFRKVLSYRCGCISRWESVYLCLMPAHTC